MAQWQADELNRSRTQQSATMPGRFAGLTREALAAVSPAAALARYLLAQEPLWQYQQRVESLDPRLLASVQTSMPWLHREVIGLVREGEDLAHAVYRASGQQDAERRGAGDLHLLSLPRQPEGWRLRLGGELFEHGGRVHISDVRLRDDGSAE